VQKIRILCEHCSTTLSVPESAVGKKIRCPKCQGIIVVAVSTTIVSGTFPSEISGGGEMGHESYTQAPPDPKRKQRHARAAKGAAPAAALHQQSNATGLPDSQSNKKAKVICSLLIVVSASIGIFLIYRNESAKAAASAAEKVGVAMLAKQTEEDLKEKALQVRHQKASLMFGEAKSLIEEGDILRGVALLEQYVSDNTAFDFKSASQLLEETKSAISNVETCDWLKSLSNEDFLRLERGERIENPKFQIPSSIAIREDSIKRNLPAEATRREASLAEMRFELAKEPLKVFLGGELTGTAAAFYRMRPLPQMQQVDLAPKNAFEKADLERRGIESEYQVNDIPLAPGALMSVSLAHYPSEHPLFGPHSLLAWSISLSRPPLVDHYKAINFDYVLGSEVERLIFQHSSSVEADGVLIEHYAFEQVRTDEFRIASKGRTAKIHSPADKVLKRMLSAGQVSYRLSTGPKEAGLTSEGVLSPEATVAIAALLQHIRLKNAWDRPPYTEEWMGQ